MMGQQMPLPERPERLAAWLRDAHTAGNGEDVVPATLVVLDEAYGDPIFAAPVFGAPGDRSEEITRILRREGFVRRGAFVRAASWVTAGESVPQYRCPVGRIRRSASPD